MTAPITFGPTSTDIFAATRAFLLAVLPTGIEVVQGQINRVAEPKSVDYVVMWPLRTPRLGTNLDTYVDTVFTASITGTTMTVTAMAPKFTGSIRVGASVWGAGVTIPTTVTALGSGTGGVGTYTISSSQTVGSEAMAAGAESLMRAAEAVLQLDVHGPNAWNNTEIVTTIFRDERGVDLFTAANAAVTPLYCTDPRQAPFVNDQQQYEDRFVIEAHLQVNAALLLPQQFAAALQQTTYPVE